MRRLATLALMTAIGCIACRPELGIPIYDNADDFAETDKPEPEPIVGADPFQEGEERLSIGAFYEGGSSEVVAIDDLTTHFYIYGLEGIGTPTFSLRAETAIVEEGLQSDRVSHGGTPWWGGGVQWDAARDLSKWTTVQLSLRSADPAFQLVQIHIVADIEAIVETADYGYLNDGEWHHIAIPLADFVGIDFTQVTAPFVFIGGGGSDGEHLYIDNVYYSQD